MSKHDLGHALAVAVERERLNEQDPLPQEIVGRVAALWLRALNEMGPQKPRSSDMVEAIIIRSMDSFNPTRFRVRALAD